MASATNRPPKKRKLVSFKYWTETTLADITPNSGKRTSGRSAVMAMEIASVHQKTAMIMMLYAV